MSRSNKLACICVIGFIAFAGGRLGLGQTTDWREAWGEPRASLIEALCRTLFPNSQFQWGLHFKLIRKGAGPVQLNLPAYSQRRVGNLWQGFTGVEMGAGKADFLAKAQTFAPIQARKFITEIVVFLAGADFHIIDYKRFELDPDEAIKRVTAMYIKQWPEGKWPILRVTYQSYYLAPQSFGSIMWTAQVDANTGFVIGKVPISIMKKHRDGSSQEDYLSVKRINASQIEVTGGLTGKTFKYPCAQICAINGQSLFDSW